MSDATDTRERRRQRAEENKESTSTPFSFKKYRVPVVILILWAAIVAYNVNAAENSADCPGHWHSTMTVYVNGDRVLFTPHPAYTLEGGTMPVKTHMHRGSESLWHFEPTGGKECIEFRDALRFVDMDISPSKLTLSGDYHANAGWGGSFENNETHKLTAWQKPWEGEWESISISTLDKMQVPDGHEILIVYGDQDDAGIAELQSQAQPNTQTPGPTTGSVFPWGPVLGISGMAVVALMVWRSFTKSAPS